MHKLYELKEKLMKELEGYASRELSTSSLDVIDKLSHATKNLAKVIEACEEEGYSNAYYGDDSYYSDRSYADNYDNQADFVRPDGSYRNSMRGRSARRDSMGRYSRGSEEIKSELRELLSKAKDEHTKSEIRKLMERM